MGANALLSRYPTPSVLRLPGPGQATEATKACPGLCLQACGWRQARARPPHKKVTLETFAGGQGHYIISPGSCPSTGVWSSRGRWDPFPDTPSPLTVPLAASMIGNCLLIFIYFYFFLVCLASVEWQLQDSQVQESKDGNENSCTYPYPRGH